MGPRVDVNPASPPKLFHQSRVDDAKLDAEFIPHLVFPLDLQGSGTDNENRPYTMSQNQFLGDEASLNGFPKAYVVRDQQIHTRHLKRPDDGIELVVLDSNPTTEWRLKCRSPCSSDRSPANRVEESV